MLTASKIELAMRCPGALTLPQSSTRNPYSDAGAARHAEREESIGKGEIPEALADAWPELDWRAEVAFAYDVATGEAREIGQGIERDYGELGPFEVAGTADAIGRGQGRLVIVDHKSFDEVTASADNPQVRFLALAAARAYHHIDSVEVGIAYEARPIDRAVLEVFDMDETAEQVRAVMLGVARARSDVRSGLAVAFNTGKQCRWCNAFDDCPRQRELVQLAKSEALSVSVEQCIPMQDDAEAADMYELWKRIGVLHKRLGAALYARATERPIPLLSGAAFGAVETIGNEQLDGPIVHAVVAEQHGRDVADAAVILSATKKRLKDALGFAGGKGKVAALERRVLDEVRARGGSKHEKSSKIEEYIPGNRQLDDGHQR